MTEGQEMDAGPLVYLASGSPQRRAVLEELGILYQLLAVDIEEIVAATPRETVEENARRKLLAGLLAARASHPHMQGEAPDLQRPRHPAADTRAARAERIPPSDRGQGARDLAAPGGPAIVLGADTVLVVQGRLLGKPADEETAVQYLQALSGGRATAYSAVAVALMDAVQGWLAVETAEVRFKVLSPEIIRWYLSTGEPMGRAGAFGIGRLGEVLTESVEGGYSCVSGLPKTALLAALAAVAGPHSTPWLRSVPAGVLGTRVRLQPVAVPVS